MTEYSHEDVKTDSGISADYAFDVVGMNGMKEIKKELI